MISAANQVRTSLVIGAAGAVIVAALLATPRPDGCARSVARPDTLVSARLISTRMLSGAHDEDIAVTIKAPAGRLTTRPPLSLAIVIDRSGSMHGAPIHNAKAAATQLVDQLDAGDAFAIVTFSSGDETVAPMDLATQANKAVARAAIERIWDDGGTCASCGLERGERELGHSPVVGGVRRMVLISDGQANEGIHDPHELAELAAAIAARGTSISTVGIGLDFDEVTMTHLADVGHGRYYFVEDTANLGAMFAAELAGLAATVATDASLVIVPSAGVEFREVYGFSSENSMMEGRVVVPVADLRAGETRNLVVHVAVAAAHPGPFAVARFELDARTVAGTAISATTELAVDVVDEPAAVAASIDRATVETVARARSAYVLEQATTLYETQGAAAAQRALDRHLDALRANRSLDAHAVQMIEAEVRTAGDGFAAAPATGEAGTRARKAARGAAYQLAH